MSSEMMNNAIFLDRDGVINKAIVKDGKPYPPADLFELEILPYVCNGISLLKSKGYKIIVITNQPDVARGTILKEKVEGINQYLKNELNIDEFYCCFHDGKENCECRKPKPGMILQAAKKWNIDITKSYMIGDRWRDIEAANAANMTSILIDYNYNEKKSVPDFSCLDFKSAIEYILKH